MTSTTLWDVSTFPPTTAAFWEGWRIEPGGITTLIGARHPWEKKPSVKHVTLTEGLKLFHSRHLIERNVLSHHAAQAVDEGGQSDGARGVAVAPNFCPCPAEVKHCTALRGLEVLIYPIIAHSRQPHSPLLR